MWVIGSKNILAQLNKQVPFSEIRHGVKNYFAFSTNSILPFDITNIKMIAKNNSCICTKNSNREYEFLIRTDLRPTLQGSDVLCSTTNFTTITSGIRVNGITPIIDSMYTHLISIIVENTSKSFAEKLTLKPLYVPVWLEDANDDSGRDIMINIDKTTGVNYLIQGVADAYKKQQQLTEFKFVISNH